MTQSKMSREMCLDAIKMGEELYHHGVLGMSWGDRNGPPYPLGGIDKREARAEYKAKREKEKRLEKMRKIAAKKRKEEKKAERKQEKLNKWKEKLIMKGNVKKIYRKRKYFTNDEIEYAMNRNTQLTEARYTKNSNKASDPHVYDKLLKFGSVVQQISTSVLPAIQVAKGVKELKALDTKARVDDAKFRSDALYTKIEKVKQFNPDMAAKLLGESLGGIEVKVKQEKKKIEPKDVADAVSGINKRIEEERKKSTPNQQVIDELNDLSLTIIKEGLMSQFGRQNPNPPNPPTP